MGLESSHPQAWQWGWEATTGAAETEGAEVQLSSKGVSKGIVPQSFPFSLEDGTPILHTLKC